MSVSKTVVPFVALLPEAKLRLILAFLAVVLVCFTVRTELGYFIRKRSPKTPLIDEDEFIVNSSDSTYSRISLDRDIEFEKSAGHFRFYSENDARVTESEFEYRIIERTVLIRLLHVTWGDAAVRELWAVRNGVVLEAAIRAHGSEEPEKVVTERIAMFDAEARRHARWCELSSTCWGGLKYFMLARNLRKSEAIPFLQQELKRLESGTASFCKAAKEFGMEPDEYGNFVLREGAQRRPEDEFEELRASAGEFGISYFDVLAASKLIVQLLGQPAKPE
jgi:hypothetical protein